jgi:hypothetical protein
MSGYSAQSGSSTIEGSQIIDDTEAEAFLIRKDGDSGDVLVVDTRDPASVSGTFAHLSVIGNGGNNIVGEGDIYKVVDFRGTLTSGTQSAAFRALQAQVTASGSSIISGIGGQGLRGGHFASIFDSTGTCSQQDGIQTNSVLLAGSSSIAGGTVTLQTGNNVVVGYSGTATGTGTVVLSAGLYVNSAQNTSAGRLITTFAGVYVENAVATGITTPYSIFTGNGIARFGGRMQWTKGADVAAANNLTLGIDGNFFNITGATQINAITTSNWTSGSILILLFASTPTVKHNTAGGGGTAKLFLAGSLDFVAAANSVLGLMYDGTQWQELFRKAA